VSGPEEEECGETDATSAMYDLIRSPFCGCAMYD
jgi:hypothetical protein